MGSSTFTESAAADTAAACARHDLAVITWVVPPIDPDAKTSRLWWFHVCRLHKLDGAESLKNIFEAA